MKKTFKDPKIHIITCKEFYKKTSYLHNCSDKNSLDNIKNANKHEYDWFLRFKYDTYYKITQSMFIEVVYGFNFLNYGTTPIYCMQEMYVAMRNGKEEYECLNEELKQLYNQTIEHPKSRNIQKLYKDLSNKIKYIKRKIPEYKVGTVVDKLTDVFDDLIQNLYKTKDEQFINKYVVLDLETNGLRRVNDDILSITIFDPSRGIAWNRLLPLELQPIVLNSYIHGITDDMLKNKNSLSQEEFNKIVKIFGLKNKIILTYSGGNFDYDFLFNYFKRHNLSGLEGLKFKNIKDLVASNGSGNITKDNLCRILNIENVTSVHSGLNDCILEWKLFEKIHENNVLVINNGVYSYSHDYVIPISYLLNYKNLRNIADVRLPDLKYTYTKVYEKELSQDLIKKIKKFDTNITGVQIEHIINCLLKAKECNNTAFLIKNKQKLKFLGMLNSQYNEINVIKNDDGSFEAVNEEDNETVDDINKVSEYLKEGLNDLIEYIKEHIFVTGEILSQELVFSEDKKIFALCDLSNKNSIIEIKTYDIFSSENTLNNTITQLFYQSNKRNTYVLSCIYGYNQRGYLNSIKITINKVIIYN